MTRARGEQTGDYRGGHAHTHTHARALCGRGQTFTLTDGQRAWLRRPHRRYAHTHLRGRVHEKRACTHSRGGKQTGIACASVCRFCAGLSPHHQHCTQHTHRLNRTNCEQLTLHVRFATRNVRRELAMNAATATLNQFTHTRAGTALTTGGGGICCNYVATTSVFRSSAQRSSVHSYL